MKNGAIPIIDHKLPNGSKIVLCSFQGKYVTWLYNDYLFYWGHYFNNHNLAFDDFMIRCKRGY